MDRRFDWNILLVNCKKEIYFSHHKQEIRFLGKINVYLYNIIITSYFLFGEITIKNQKVLLNILTSIGNNNLQTQLQTPEKAAIPIELY